MAVERHDSTLLSAGQHRRGRQANGRQFRQNVHEYDAKGKTLSFLDLSQYDQLVAMIDPTASAFGQQLLSNRSFADSVVFGASRAESYGKSERDNSRASIDLTHFAQLLRQKSPDSATSQALDNLIAAVDRFVVHSNQGWLQAQLLWNAIDAPENTDEQFASDKINDTWLGFQRAYVGMLQGDTQAPVVEAVNTNANADELELVLSHVWNQRDRGGAVWFGRHGC